MYIQLHVHIGYNGIIFFLKNTIAYCDHEFMDEFLSHLIIKTV